MIEQLERVSPGSDPLDVLDVKQQPEPLPPFPSLDRGVTLLSVWLQGGGGGTPEFKATLNGLVREEDGDPAPLMSSLVNLTALMLQMTAAALGAAPETILADLLEQEGDGAPG